MRGDKDGVDDAVDFLPPEGEEVGVRERPGEVGERAGGYEGREAVMQRWLLLLFMLRICCC
jgi:hypothetical protein